MHKRSLLEKIDFLLTVSKKGTYTQEELQDILALTRERSEHGILGRFMGYSVSDYAIATLYWLGTKETKAEYNALTDGLSDFEKQEICALIEKKPYLQL